MSGASQAGDLTGPRWLALLAGAIIVHTVVSLERPLASYIALDLGAPAGVLGLVAASYALFPLVLALPSGRLSDKVGGRGVTIAGIIFCAMGAALMLVVADFFLLYLALALLGIGHLLAMIGMQVLVAHHSPIAEFDSRFGIFAFASSAGQLAGPALLALFAVSSGAGDLEPALMAGTAMAALGLLSILGLARLRPLHPTKTADGTPDVSRLPLKQILRAPGITPALIASLSVLAASDILLVYLPALGKENTWSATVVGVLLALRAGSSMASRLFLGRLVRGVGRERLLASSLIVAAASLIGLALVKDPIFAAVLITVGGLALGVGQPLSMTVVAAGTAPRARATALSLRLMANRAGQMGIPLLAGAVAAATATAGVIFTAAAIVALSAVTIRKPDAPAEPTDPAT